MTRKAPVVLIPAICRKWKTLQGYRQSRALCNGLPVRAIFNDLESLWRSFVCCKVFRIQFYEYFFLNISHGFNWHGASRSTSATAEFLVLFTVVCDIIKFLPARHMRVIYRARSCCVWTSGDPLLCPPVTAVVSGAKASPVCEFHSTGSASPTECCGIFDWRCLWNMNEITVNHHHRLLFSLAV